MSTEHTPETPEFDALTAVSAAQVHKRLRTAGYDSTVAVAKVAEALGIAPSVAGPLIGRGVGILGGSRD